MLPLPKKTPRLSVCLVRSVCVLAQPIEIGETTKDWCTGIPCCASNTGRTPGPSLLRPRHPMMPMKLQQSTMMNIIRIHAPMIDRWGSQPASQPATASERATDRWREGGQGETPSHSDADADVRPRRHGFMRPWWVARVRLGLGGPGGPLAGLFCFGVLLPLPAGSYFPCVAYSAA